MSKGKSFKDTLKYTGTCFTMECYPFAPHPCDRQSQEAVSPEISWSASSVITARQQGQKENSSHKTIFNATFLFFFLLLSFRVTLYARLKKTCSLSSHKESIYPLRFQSLLFSLFFFFNAFISFQRARRDTHTHTKVIYRDPSRLPVLVCINSVMK